jgi:hypothetical protein
VEQKIPAGLRLRGKFFYPFWSGGWLGFFVSSGTLEVGFQILDLWFFFGLDLVVFNGSGSDGFGLGLGLNSLL